MPAPARTGRPSINLPKGWRLEGGCRRGRACGGGDEERASAKTPGRGGKRMATPCPRRPVLGPVPTPRPLQVLLRRADFSFLDTPGRSLVCADCRTAPGCRALKIKGGEGEGGSLLLQPPTGPPRVHIFAPQRPPLFAPPPPSSHSFQRPLTHRPPPAAPPQPPPPSPAGRRPRGRRRRRRRAASAPPPPPTCGGPSARRPAPPRPAAPPRPPPRAPPSCRPPRARASSWASARRPG